MIGRKNLGQDPLARAKAILIQNALASGGGGQDPSVHDGQLGNAEHAKQGVYKATVPIMSPIAKQKLTLWYLRSLLFRQSGVMSDTTIWVLIPVIRQ